MDVQCSSCHKVIQIPDAKVPTDASFSFVCPYCRERVRVDGTPSPKAGENDPPTEKRLGPPEDASTVDPDSIPPNTAVAFVFVEDEAWRIGAEKYFQSIGHFCVVPKNVETARAKLAIQHHDVILVQDSPASGSLMEVIDSWRGLDRRACDVVLLSKEIESLAPEEAFLRGVNTCLCVEDRGRIEELLGACLKEYELLVMPWEQAGNAESAV
ncbi:zinc ribbon domain-containing protein [Desulfoplanes sp.]